MKSILRKCKHSGFTLLEMMVGVILFMIGVLGFSGMITMQARGTQVAKGLDDAASLVQSQVEDLAAVGFTNLGNDASLQNPEMNGLNNGNVWTEGPLNRKGETLGSGTGPFIYYRNTVICDSTMNGVAAGASPTYCGGSLVGALRPPELACNNLSPALLANREKLIRVLVGWSDQNGKCHYKTTNSLSFQ